MRSSSSAAQEGNQLRALFDQFLFPLRQHLQFELQRALGAGLGRRRVVAAVLRCARLRARGRAPLGVTGAVVPRRHGGRLTQAAPHGTREESRAAPRRARTLLLKLPV